MGKRYFIQEFGSTIKKEITKQEYLHYQRIAGYMLKEDQVVSFCDNENFRRGWVR